MLLLMVLASALGAREELFDDNWRFIRGDSIADGHVCANAAFPVDLEQTRCMGLSRVPGAHTPAACQDACCVHGTCATWQFCPGGACADGGVEAKSCWVGARANCHNTTDGWISRARHVPAPSPPRTCRWAFCKVHFDDSAWQLRDVPHDWSSDDLPPREKDTSTPVVAIRNGTWLFHEGDNASWSKVSADDKDWELVSVPSDWRDPPLKYTKENAYGWYRRHFVFTKEHVGAAMRGVLRIGLGTVAGTDETYLNGVKIGGVGNAEQMVCGDYLQYRSYLVPPTIEVGPAVIAVRVFSQGGEAHPGGLCDTGGPDERVGMIDAAASPGWRQTGYAVGGVGWYRKNFTVTNSGRIAIRFDGVYMNSEVYVNEKFVGLRPYGYTTFEYDITDALVEEGKDNVLAIRVANLGSNSRWYSGSGIYRHVHVVSRPAVHVPLWGVGVLTPEISSAHARVSTTVQVKNTLATTFKGSVRVDVVESDSLKIVATSSSPASVTNNATDDVLIDALVHNPRLWDIASPVTYFVSVQILDGDGKVVDIVNSTFGFRTFSFSNETGFVLNGRTVLLKGGCVHHANGPLGAAAIDRADERRVELLKAQGYNAIRTSHNPPSPAFVDACDRHGILLMEEAFDCWEQGKNPDDYHLYFDEWWEKDIESMVLRDRNHPSIVMWSIGNEIPERATQRGYDEAKMLADKVRSLDHSGRAVTSAWPQVNTKADPYFAHLDVAGYNYSPTEYRPSHERIPSRIIVATESFPAQSFQYWMGVTNNTFVIGDFIWTAIDYIGESSIGANGHYPPDPKACDAYCAQPAPYHISFCGDIDITGGRKPQSFYRSVLWNESTLEFAVHAPGDVDKEAVGMWGWPDERQSWSGTQGQQLQVRVFTRGDHAQLFVNDMPHTAAPVPVSVATEFMYVTSVAYQPGNITAVAFANSKVIATRTFLTSGSPHSILLHADRSHILSSRSDVSFITASIVDRNGVLVPGGQVQVEFSLTGNGEIAAVASADPVDPQSARGSSVKTYRGRCLVVIRPGDLTHAPARGALHLTASAPGLLPASVDITVE